MRRHTVLSWTLALAALTGGALAIAPAQATAPGQNGDRTRAAKIRNALSAAPKAVAEQATVYDWPAHAGDKMPVLQRGTDGWSCLPDDPTTPTNDPQCMNAAGMAWMDALMNHRTPHLTSPGLDYVLQGCTVASNTDPYATTPPPGRHWIATGPHVMVFPADGNKLDRDTYGTDPTSGLPYIRWAGTPYEHLVVPAPTTK